MSAVTELLWAGRALRQSRNGRIYAKPGEPPYQGTGYAVDVPSTEWRGEPSAEMLAEYVRRVYRPIAGHLEGVESVFLSILVVDSAEYYVNTTVIAAELSWAEQLGRQWDQLSIWDFSRRREYFL